MKPTPIGLLAAAAVAVGAVVYALFSLAYDDLPPVPLYAAATVAFLAVAEMFTATSVRARLQNRPGTRPVDRLAVARLVALAKASAWAGALATGGYAAVLAYVAQQLDNPHKAHDAAASAIGVGGSLLLVGAALLLERVCRVPPSDDDDDRPGPTRQDDPFTEWQREHNRR